MSISRWFHELFASGGGGERRAVLVSIDPLLRIADDLIMLLAASAVASFARRQQVRAF